MTKKDDKEFLSPTYYKLGLIIFSIVCILVIARDSYLNNYTLFFWFCDFVPFLILIAFIFRNKDMINGIINTGLIVQIVYIAVVISHYLSGGGDIKVNSYFVSHFPELNLWKLNIQVIPLPDIFAQGFVLIALGIILHLTIILAAIMFIKKPSSKESILYSLLVVFFMYLPTLLFTSLSMNFNQIIEYNGLESLLPFYTQIWPVWFLIILILPTYFLRNYIASRFNKNK